MIEPDKILIESNKINCLVGSIIESIIGLEKHSEELEIKTNSGDIKFYLGQDGCESDVRIEDFVIDDDLCGAKILDAEEVVSYGDGSDDGINISSTWTFYKIETNKGGLFVRWLGESNGYYSERVDHLFTEKNND